MGSDIGIYIYIGLYRDNGKESEHDYSEAEDPETLSLDSIEVAVKSAELREYNPYLLATQGSLDIHI